MKRSDIRRKTIILTSILIGLFGALLAVREAVRPSFEHRIPGDELISINREEANGSGYIVEKQVFFDTDSEYPSQIVTPEMNLEKGRYEIAVTYRTTSGNHTVYAYSHAGRYREVVTDQVPLPPDRTTRSFESRLQHGLFDFQVRINTDDSRTEIDGITVRRLNGSAMILCNTLFLIFLFLSIAVFYEKIRLRTISAGQLTILAGLTGIILLAALPSGLAGITESKGFEDLSFHLWRIEGIAQGLRDGFFPVRIYSEYLNGYGYANGIYYGNTLLYLPAVMRIMGYSVTVSYKAYILLIHILTAVTAYWCFRRISGRDRIGLAGSALYTLAPYRLVNVYDRAAVGEYTALCFLPLVFCGLWMICVKHEKKEYTTAIAALAAGCTGIIQSHLLSAILTGICGLGFIVWFWKSFIRKEKILALFQALFWVLLLNLWFVIPLLDCMLTQQTRITADKVFKIQKYGQDLSYLTALVTGKEYQVPRSLGIALLCIPVLWMAVRLLAHYNNRVCAYKKEMTGIALIGTGCLFLTMHLFPYDFLCKNSSLFNALIGKIQFPWRWLGIAGFFLVLLYCLSLAELVSYQKKYAFALSAGILALAVLQAAGMQYLIMNRSVQKEYYGTEGLQQSFLYQVYQGEYMAANADMSEMEYDRRVLDDDNIVWEYMRDDGRFELVLENYHRQDAEVILPLQYYKGYTARDSESGEKFTVYGGERSRTAVIIPAGYEGKLIVSYQGMWYWRVSDVISLLGTIVAVSLVLRRYFCNLKQNMIRCQRQNGGSVPS